MDTLEIEFIDKPISEDTLRSIADRRFGDMVKAVVDTEKGCMAVGGELHSDEEAFLLNKGSNQADLWGINIYPDLDMPDALEFDSMINIRPSQNNSSRDVEDKETRTIITKIVITLIPHLS